MTLWNKNIEVIENDLECDFSDDNFIDTIEHLEKNSKQKYKLFEGKGDLDDLRNYLHIHLKDFICKAFETGLVIRLKRKFISACSKFQI